PAGESRRSRRQPHGGASEAEADAAGEATTAQATSRARLTRTDRAILKRGQTYMNYVDNNIRDPGVCGGEPVIKGTRVLLRTILASLAEGDTTDQIVRSFPT